MREPLPDLQYYMKMEYLYKDDVCLWIYFEKEKVYEDDTCTRTCVSIGKSRCTCICICSLICSFICSCIDV